MSATTLQSPSPNIYRKALALRLRESIESRSQMEVARALGITRQRLNNYLTGYRSMPHNLLRRFATETGQSVDSILEDAEKI